MGSAANVKTADAIVRFRAGLAEFGDEIKLAIAEAHADVQKTVQFIEMERLPHWTTRVRKLHDKVQQAKSELYRAEIASRDERPSCVIQRKALAKVKAELEEAERKVTACKRWITLLDRETMLFRAALAQISTTVELDIPNGLAHMDRLLDALAKYFSTVVPSDTGRLPDGSHVDAPPPEADAPAPPTGGAPSTDGSKHDRKETDE